MPGSVPVSLQHRCISLIQGKMKGSMTQVVAHPSCWRVEASQEWSRPLSMPALQWKPKYLRSINDSGPAEAYCSFAARGSAKYIHLVNLEKFVLLCLSEPPHFSSPLLLFFCSDLVPRRALHLAAMMPIGFRQTRDYTCINRRFEEVAKVLFPSLC